MYVSGLMNTVGAVLIVFLGLQASKIVIYYHNSSIRMIVWCVMTVSKTMFFEDVVY